ncbi:hypothetical protein [uncultured Acetobacteroides sp.]|uniref:hypothetical protein n=1 Tax=uncultured Acetobacteroides sp. TaxID=1760811 RepID=UPI0029F4F901|nr:hypothetical protein [uncultured Acetobacteroides sp.]
MKTRIVYILIIFSIFCSCSKVKDLKEKEVYGILNEIMEDDSLMFSKIDVAYLDMPLNSSYLNEFSSKDKEFIKKQYEKNRMQKVDTNQLKLYRPKRKVVLVYGNDSVIYKGPSARISYPYISMDRKKVLLMIIDDSEKSGGTYLYIKENDHWKKKKTLDRWIS